MPIIAHKTEFMASNKYDIKIIILGEIDGKPFSLLFGLDALIIQMHVRTAIYCHSFLPFRYN